ncbi:cellulose biosynthesis protein BcsN [Peteryoungia desertarenae]|uniref:Cellulose biosynthesis protein BcsN n=1 Tax=Peteryoungia desertarenae TaxID=1813451 RepID=A0ABX6QJR0_9HYPH|nr:cellulose biosynthesis protein BcsN [Peteryoungia desertarenae]QLF68522.1 cellulose biosynthesis protein BcsN [Peteryoungia desertarenae]
MRAKPLLSLSLLLLTGCTTIDDPWLTGAAQTPGTQQNRHVAVHTAWGALHGLKEAPIAVRQLSGQEGPRQEIVFANDTPVIGENMLVIERLSRGKSDTEQTVNRSSLSAEIDRSLPDIRLHTGPIMGTNSYGRYGAVVGATNKGASCVYAWQQIGKSTVPDPLKVRLRYCSADAEPTMLSSLLSSLTLRLEGLDALSGNQVLQTAPLLYSYSFSDRGTDGLDEGRKAVLGVEPRPLEHKAAPQSAEPNSVLVPMPR